MKKISSIWTAKNLNFARLPLMKVLFLALVVIFLSNISPSFSKSAVSQEILQASVEEGGEGYLKSFVSVDDNALDIPSISRDGYLTSVNAGIVSGSNTSEDYVNFFIKALLSTSNTRPIVNILTAHGNSVKVDMQDLLRAVSDQKSPQLTKVADVGAVNIPVNVQANNNSEKDQILNVSKSEVNQAINARSMSIQTRAVAYAPGVEIGDGAQSGGKSNIAIGLGFSPPPPNGGSVYHAAWIAKDNYNAIAIGSNAYIRQGANSTVVIGHNTEVGASSSGSTIIGGSSDIGSNAKYSTALGFVAKVRNNIQGAVALGYYSKAITNGGVRGYDPKAGKISTSSNMAWQSASNLGAVSIGDVKDGKTRQITGLAAGTEDTDAVNVAQLKALEKAIGKGSSSGGGGDSGWTFMSIGDVTQNETAIVVDVNSEKPLLVQNDSNVKITGESGGIKFSLNDAITVESVNLGKTILSESGLIFANGPSISASGIDAGRTRVTGLALGDISEKSTDAVTGAQLAKLAQQTGFAWVDDLKRFVPSGEETFLAPYISVDGEHDIPKDPNDWPQGTGIGGASFGPDGSFFTYTNIPDAFSATARSLFNVNKRLSNVFINSLVWNEEAGAFVAQHEVDGKKVGSKITFLANGDVKPDSVDAITGAQLYDTNSKIAEYLGGGASYKDGTWAAPTFTIRQFGKDGTSQDATYNTVADAFAGVGTSFENVNNRFTDVVSSFDNKLADITKIIQGDALLWSETEDAFVAMHGEKKSSSKIKYLAKGDINANSTNAINGSQLYALGTSVAKSLGGGASYENGTWKVPTFTLKQFGKDGTSKDATYNTVAAAFAGVGASFTNIENKITNDINKEINKTKNDALLWSNGKGAFVAAHGQDGAKSNSKITSLQAGIVSEGSTDAINGSQLHVLGASVAKSLGGEASYKDGTWIGPTFMLKQFDKNGLFKEETYHNVTAAFAGIDTNFTNVVKNFDTKIDDITAQVQGDALLWDKDADAFVAKHGEEKSNSKIKYLAQGDISVSSSDAVNGSQLFETNTTV
ncbi:autotransporter adhesin, partial [Bartonella silvatica]